MQTSQKMLESKMIYGLGAFCSPVKCVLKSLFPPIYVHVTTRELLYDFPLNFDLGNFTRVSFA
jgi:hypothetical protein